MQRIDLIFINLTISIFFYMQPKVQQQKRKKGQAKPEYKNLNAFKGQQKHYKLYQNQETDFSKLFSPSQQNFVEVEGYQVCELPFPQGAYYVRNFTPYQKVVQIAYYGLNQYCKRPYRTNLDSREQLYTNSKQQGQQQHKMEEQATKDIETQSKQIKQQEIKIEQQKLEKLEEKESGFVFQNGFYFNEKIRWANVGYQYDWTLRKYPQLKTPIHPSIQELSNRANILYNQIEHIKKNYEPESAIINYYGQKDYMTGHLDDAQIDQQSPIYSFSFGLSCIFLIGGRTKDEQPTAIRLNSGDLLIMAGQSRKCYHGVPRVLSGTFRQPNQQEQQIAKQYVKSIQQKQAQKIVNKQEHNSYDNVKCYLNSHRININIRQVYPRN